MTTRSLSRLTLLLRSANGSHMAPAVCREVADALEHGTMKQRAIMDARICAADTLASEHLRDLMRDALFYFEHGGRRD